MVKMRSSSRFTPNRGRTTSRQSLHSRDEVPDSQKSSAAGGEGEPMDPLAMKLAMMRQGSANNSPMRSPPGSASKVGLLSRVTSQRGLDSAGGEARMTFKQKQKAMQAQKQAERASSADPNDVFGATVRRIAEEKKAREEAEAAAKELAEKKAAEKALRAQRGAFGWLTGGSAAATIEEGDEDQYYDEEQSFNSDIHSSMPSSLASYELGELDLREKRTYYEVRRQPCVADIAVGLNVSPDCLLGSPTVSF
jgi:hypothetical protein